jgi:hypothetical protein
MSNLIGESSLRLAKVAAASVVGVLVFALLVGPSATRHDGAGDPQLALRRGLHPAGREQPDLTVGDAATPFDTRRTVPVPFAAVPPLRGWQPGRVSVPGDVVRFDCQRRRVHTWMSALRAVMPRTLHLNN